MLIANRPLSYREDPGQPHWYDGIFDERVEATPLPDDLMKPYAQIQAQARVIAKVSQESKLDLNEEEYLASLKWQLMETVLAWAAGKPFAEVW